MAIIIGSDHQGYPLKESIKRHFRALGSEVFDRGCHGIVPADYPEHGARVARDVAAGLGKGILICATGIGMSMVANKFPGIRAALCRNELDAERSRQHMDANIICLSGMITPLEVAIRLVDRFLREPFQGDEECHQRRVNQIENLLMDNSLMS